MRKRSTILSCATTAACFASTIPASGTAFFLAPPTVTTSVPGGLSLQRTSHGISSKHPFHPRSTLRYKVAKEGGSNALAGFRRSRPRSHATRTSMVFGGGGGGRGPKTPFGLSTGSIVTIGFALLVFFAPGVVFGAFNTLFLVRGFAVTIPPGVFCFTRNANFKRLSPDCIVLVNSCSLPHDTIFTLGILLCQMEAKSTRT